MHLQGEGAKGGTTAGQRPGEGEKADEGGRSSHQEQAPAWPLARGISHHPPKLATTHLRAKRKLMAEAAEKFEDYLGAAAC